MATKKKVDVFTDEYEGSHWTKPRGRGSWCFSRVADYDVADEDGAIWEHGTYTEARRAAVKEAKARGWDALFVQP